MLTRELITNLLELQKRKDSLFSRMPSELINLTCNYDEDPSSDISKALKFAAYARQEDVDALLSMLEANPSLLLQKGKVKTPGGDILVEVTIYECLLGAGDYELAALVQPYFAKLAEGEEERVRQYERYRPSIEGMLKQKPYDLSHLVELIKQASPEEVTALLNNDLTGDTKLCKALIQFHKDWAPRLLQEPCMHFNYASLKHALELLVSEWDNLYQTSGNNNDKLDLMWQQLIGFEMRRLPGIDRCVMAQSLYAVIEKKYVCRRSYTITQGLKESSDFPITDSDDSLNGISSEFPVSIFDSCSVTDWASRTHLNAPAERVRNLMSIKHFKLTELMEPAPAHQLDWCTIA